MTEGGKDAIRKTGDHNWDMERMQFQKERGNVSAENDYINLETKAARVQEAMGSNNGDEPRTTTNKIYHAIQKRSKKHRERKGRLELARKLCNFMAFLARGIILPLDASMSDLFWLSAHKRTHTCLTELERGKRSFSLPIWR